MLFNLFLAIKKPLPVSLSAQSPVYSNSSSDAKKVRVCEKKRTNADMGRKKKNFLGGLPLTAGYGRPDGRRPFSVLDAIGCQWFVASLPRCARH